MNIRRIIRDILLEADWEYTSLRRTNPKPSDKDPWNESGVRLTAVSIEEKGEIAKLENQLDKTLKKYNIEVPQDWKRSNEYHMTIQLGAMQLRQRIIDVGKEVELTAHSFGVSDSNMAFGVTGYMSKNAIQHITVAFKNAPSDSNFITNWIPLSESFTLKGIIREYREQ